MNQTHIHLLITHLPIFGSILGCFVLSYGMWTKTSQTAVAAYYVFIISAIGATIAYFTGEAAEETVENLAAVTENSIEAHEQSAIVALFSSIVLGIVSLVGSYVTARKPERASAIAFVVLCLAIINFGITGRTGYLGGQIRHTEIATEATTPTKGEEIEEED